MTIPMGVKIKQLTPIERSLDPVEGMSFVMFWDNQFLKLLIECQW